MDDESRWQPSYLYDWDDARFMAHRAMLCEILRELDAFFDEVRRDDHEGGCWDLVNSLAQILALTDYDAVHGKPEVPRMRDHSEEPTGTGSP